jgi:hypothetical protein
MVQTRIGLGAYRGQPLTVAAKWTQQWEDGAELAAVYRCAAYREVQFCHVG